jgi:hypothetical protein
LQLPHLTAIDDEDFAGDEGRAGAGEEGRGAGDFLDRAEAAERGLARGSFPPTPCCSSRRM